MGAGQDPPAPSAPTMSMIEGQGHVGAPPPAYDMGAAAPQASASSQAAPEYPEKPPAYPEKPVGYTEKPAPVVGAVAPHGQAPPPQAQQPQLLAQPQVAPVGAAPGQALQGVEPDPMFPNQEYYKLPQCATCGVHNGVPGLRPGITFVCFRCRAMTWLPPDWAPKKPSSCTIM